MTATSQEPSSRPASPARPRLALCVVALAQLTIALDATIVNVALPSAQAALGFTDTQRHWVITAYTVAFGGALLLGGRISDEVGRRRAFVVGLLGFGAASGLGALAPNLALLAAARAGQGLFAALLAPTVLALLSVTFTEPRERGRAFALFGAVAGGGGAVGLVLGGLLAETVGWRGCLWINVPIVVLTVLGSRALPGTGPAGAPRRRWDVPGALLGTGGLVVLVAACAGSVPSGWTPGLVVAGVVLLAGFAFREAHAPAPLLPLRLLADRVLVGACLTVALAVAAMLGAFLVLTYVLQVVLGFSPLQAGTAFLALSGALFAGSQLAGRMLARVAPRTLVVPGLLVAATGMALLTRLSPDSTFATCVLPAELLIGAGIGVVFTPLISLATGRAAPRDAGVTAAVLTTAQQIGGSLGVAALSALAAAPISPGSAHPTTDTLLAGYTTAAGWAAVALLVAAVVSALMVTAPRPDLRIHSTERN